MLLAQSSCVVALGLLCTLPALFSQDPLPDVWIRPLAPYGVMVTISHVTGMKYFEFRGNVKRPLRNILNNDIYIAVGINSGNNWTGIDNNVRLRVGDPINYYVRVDTDNTPEPKGTEFFSREYIVTELYEGNNLFPCYKPVTEIMYKTNRRDKYCGGQYIFEEHFDTLREDKWTVESYIPAAPEYPFVSYQQRTVSVNDSYLRIEPQLLQNLLGFNRETVLTGELDLSKIGCTREDKYCNFRSNGPQILHPIISGKISSAAHFAFKYGTIEVRAKVPQGDWLYPDILLEAVSRYSCNEHQRVLRIAGARGNLLLSKGTEEYGNKLLYGGPLMNIKCRNNRLATKMFYTDWGNDFHVYSLRWETEMIKLFVDGEEWRSINITASDLQSHLPRETCGSLCRISNQQTCKKPFDDFYGITLGVSAGGILEFPDDVTSGTTPKPWRNTEHKARLKFYQAIDTWLPTWTQKELIVDYVRVMALCDKLFC